MKRRPNRTIFALSTTYGQSAIAVYRISGKACKAIAYNLCKIKKIKERFAYYSNIFDLDGKLIDRGLIIFFKAPKSYTGEDVLEIHTHGSTAIINKLTQVISKIKNTRVAQPGEFSKRAFLNGKGDLLFFEGINNLIKSETENQRLIANKQIDGENSLKCELWREKILDILAFIDAEIEFGDDIECPDIKKIQNGLHEISKEIKEVFESFDSVRNLVHGSNLLIIGPTNAGKSSFFNLLIQDNKMIVSPVKGTTTDQLKQAIEINGKKVNLIDTAGIRDGKGKVEKIGVAKTLESINTHNKIIIVLSPDSIDSPDFKKIEKVFNNLDRKNCIVIFNKIDLKNAKKKIQEWKQKISKIKNMKSITISCKKPVNKINMLNKCYKFIDRNLLSVDTNNDDHYFSELRHKESLKNVLFNLESAVKNISSFEISAKYLRDAMNDLDELYGRHNEEDKLEIIFNNFCIGK